MNLKTLIVASLLAGFAGLASAGNISLNVAGEVSPGVYGRVDIGRQPPVLVYEQPVIITRPVHVVSVPPPLYLAVPPGHAKHWAKHCGRYNACARPTPRSIRPGASASRTRNCSATLSAL